MYLKKIELTGFKSFADRTEIVFEKGITCVVGPNGCGKSNVVDAIQWVLGERSPKALRGSSMQDVIFNGTDFRSATGFCEVSLTLDNQDQSLPIPFSDVVLTRRLYRTGESQYLLNKTVCRARDIQDVILDTGIGRNAYSVIGQGKVGDILNAEGEDRRVLIEEAAGISKYEVKKQEALRKLERTEQNLLRLNDIVVEVERNIRYAERQAKRAEEYKAVRDELARLACINAFWELGVLGSRRHSSTQERERLEAQEASLRRDLQAMEESVRAKQAQMGERLEKLRAAERAAMAQEAEVQGLALKVELFEQELAEKCKSQEALLTQLYGSPQGLASLDASEKAIEGDLNTVEAELADLAVSQEAHAAGLSQLREEIARLDGEAKILRDTVFEETSETSRLRNQLEALHRDLVRNRAERARVEREMTRLSENLGSLEGARVSEGVLEHEIETLSARVKEKEQAFNERCLEGEQLGRKLRELAEARACAERDYLLKRERQRNLKEEERKLSEFLVERNQGGRLVAGLMKPLREILEAEPGYERALEAALEDCVSLWLVDHLAAATRILAEVEGTDSLGRVRLLVRAHPNGTRSGDLKDPLLEGKLLDFVKVKEGFEDAAKALLGSFYVGAGFNETTAARLLELARERTLVTREGHRIGSGPIVVGGRFANGSVSAFGDPEKSLTVLAERQNALEETLKAISLSFEAWRKTCASERELLEATRLEHARCSGRREGSRDREAGDSTLRERLSQETQLLAKEQALLDEESRDLEARENETSQLLESAFEREQATRRRLEQAEALLVQNTAAEGLQAARGTQLEADRLVLLERRTFTLRRLEDVGQRARAQREAGQDQAFVSTLQERARELERKISEARAAREGLEKACEAARLQTQQMAGELEDERRSGEEGQEALERTRGVLDLTREALNGVKLSETQHHYEEQAIYERMEQAFEIRLRDLNAADYEMPENLSAEALHVQITALREKSERLGTVNLLAIEEYKELSERYEFLSRQKQDLERARVELLEAIRQINRTTRELFTQTLAAVREKFQDMFRILFGGGQADLCLMDESNPLESGIDIVARPPGKKLQRMSLLSGGERALTAIALLFALFAIKPSPFCLLDEVDAPLDEANVDRFGALLKRFIGQSQFIVITHNRKTIGNGDALYGVTMQEPGVSRVVSVRLAAQGTVDAEDRETAQTIERILV